MKPLLIVVYDFGSAGPADIAAAARDVCDLVFVADPGRPHVADNLHLLRSAAPVVETGSDPEAVAGAVADLKPAGITTFSEAQIGLTAFVAERLGLRYHDRSVALAVTDKLTQRDALTRAGIATVRHRAITAPDDVPRAVAEVGLPAVLKPRHGAGSSDTYKVSSLAEGLDAVATAFRDGRNGGGLILEELLIGDPAAVGPQWGDYVSVESVTIDGESQHIAVTGKFPLAEPFRETGQFLPATLTPDRARQVTALTSKVLRALGVRHGVTHTEVKFTPEGPRIIEINGRVGGYVADLLRRSSGYDLLRTAMLAATGLPPDAAGPAFHRVAFRRYLATPAAEVVLTGLDGMDHLAALPGVDHVEVRARVGQALDWRHGTQECLGVVYGHAEDHTALLGLVQEADACVTAAYEPASGNPDALLVTEA